jgi:hypothetical protein
MQMFAQPKRGTICKQASTFYLQIFNKRRSALSKFKYFFKEFSSNGLFTKFDCDGNIFVSLSHLFPSKIFLVHHQKAFSDPIPGIESTTSSWD